VRAAQRVQAIVGDHEAAHGLSADEVGLDNLVQIFLAHAAIPHRLGIDDHVGAVLALVETAGFVGPNSAFESALGELGLQRLLQLSLTGGVAASARTGGISDVGTDEYVALKLWHVPTVYQCAEGYISLNGRPCPALRRKKRAVHLMDCGVIRL